MATPNFTIFEDTTTLDVVWMRVSDPDEAPTGPGQLEDHGTFTVRRASPPASSSSTQTSAASSVPMIATFTWDNFSAAFSCDYNQATGSYDHFDLVEGSMSEDFASALLYAAESNTDLHIELSEWDEGVWKLEMTTMYSGLDPSYVELWAKKRVDGVRMEATGSDRRDWGLAQDASEDEEEDEGEGEDQEVDSAQDASVDEEEDEGEGEDQEVDSSEDESDAEGEGEEEQGDEEEEEHSDA